MMRMMRITKQQGVDRLIAQRNQLTSTATAGDNASTDTSGDGGGVVGGEDGL